MYSGFGLRGLKAQSRFGLEVEVDVEMDVCADVVLRWTDALMLWCEGRMC